MNMLGKLANTAASVDPGSHVLLVPLERPRRPGVGIGHRGQDGVTLVGLQGGAHSAGTTQAGWTRLPPSLSIISWPNRRRAMPSRAISGAFSTTPRMLRLAGSESKPRSRSGEDRWKKLRAWDCTIWARFMTRRNFTATGRHGDAQDLVARFSRGNEVADGADTADTGHQRRHLVQRPALGYALEAPELGDVEVGVADLPRLVKKDGDLGVTLDPGHRFDNDLAHFSSSDQPKRALGTLSGTCPSSRPTTTSNIRSAEGGHPGTKTSTGT